MFQRKKRFPRADFPTALRSGRRFTSPHFIVVVPKVSDGYAVVVSKKTARLSVTRHKIKRKILAILRTLQLPKAMIVFPKPSLSSVHYRDMEKELSDLLSNIKY
ncbi:MAG: ribonuclease P protein component [bacterium]